MTVSDDIVTRLRAYNIGNIAHEASSHMEETLYEAADEIERLRAELENVPVPQTSWDVRVNAAFGENYDEQKLLDIITRAVRKEA